MLEIRNVTKVYKTKGGVETRALDDVSITFGETGMVFLLGKSGSGKSTLLNVSGGLDEPTSGEVIVKGKSSKDFSGSDFDSYRNTFVGFIFQEYNVLNEFNVEDNIALALDLQGKKKDKEKIAALLEEVDMAKFAKRKPNTLSGGQKQRIAIARALVKDPQIIMADEPTGALDSATGKQVFETLKKLSQTRLVIVVSHDREFAEIYGDRIVELADGKIISDVTKSYAKPQEIDENVSIIADNTLSVKSGAKLTKKNIDDIQKFISSADGDVIITKGEREKKAFRTATRMTEAGETEKFDATDTSKIVSREYTAEESGFIKSRLPAAKAIKIGASGLKLKPVRLIFTILLSFVAFTMFGLFSTVMFYNSKNVVAASFADSDTRYIDIGKNFNITYTYDDYTSNSYNRTGFTPADIESLEKAYGAPVVGYYGYTYNYISSTPSSWQNVRAEDSDEGALYWTPYTDKFVESSAAEGMWTTIAGGLPTAKDQICISKYLADTILKYGIHKIQTTGGSDNINYETTATEYSDYDHLTGEKIVYGRDYNSSVFRICGVFDSGELPSKYDSLKSKRKQDNLDDGEKKLQAKYYNSLTETPCTAGIVADGFYKAYKNKGLFETFTDNYYFRVFEYTNTTISADISYKNYSNPTIDDYGNQWDEKYNLSNEIAVYSSEKAEQLDNVMFFGDEKTSLSDGEVILSASNLSMFIDYLRSKYLESVNLPLSVPSEEYTFYNEKLGYEGSSNIVQLINDITKYDAEEEQITEAMQGIKEIVNKALGNGEITFDLKLDGISEGTGKVVGIYIGSYGGMFVSQSVYDGCQMNEDTNNSETNYKPESDAVYAGAMVKYDGSRAMMQDILKTIGFDNKNENDVFFVVNNSLYQEVDTVNDMVSALKLVFLIVGIVFAVFSSLLLFNFLSMSISNKKKEIGILRAVGARGTDVFKIFFAESGIIVLICLVLALIGTVIACGFINKAMANALGATITIFAFGWLTPVMMIALALAVAVIATFLPVFFAARKKPVDSIRAL